MPPARPKERRRVSSVAALSSTAPAGCEQKGGIERSAMSYRRPGAAPGNYSRTPTCTHRQTLCANSSPTTLSALSFAPCKPGANVHHDRTRVVRCDTRRHNILRTEKRQQRKGNKECVSCCVSTREALVFTSCPRSHAHLDHGLAAIELRERKEDSSGRGVRRRTTRPLTAASRSAAQPSRFQSSHHHNIARTRAICSLAPDASRTRARWCIRPSAPRSDRSMQSLVCPWGTRECVAEEI